MTDPQIAEIAAAEDRAWQEARELVRGTNADMCKTPGAAYRLICEAMTDAGNNREARTLAGRVRRRQRASQSVAAYLKEQSQ